MQLLQRQTYKKTKTGIEIVLVLSKTVNFFHTVMAQHRFRHFSLSLNIPSSFSPCIIALVTSKKVAVIEYEDQVDRSSCLFRRGGQIVVLF